MLARVSLRGRRWRALLLAAAFACLACAHAWAQQPLAAIPALDSPVVDTTGTLEPTQRAQLERQALDLQRRKGSQLQVLIVASTQPESIEQYAQRVFDAWRIGREGVDDAVLVLVARDDRRVRIQPGYGLEGAIPDITAGRIIQEYMAPKFRAGDYGGGLVDATAVLVRLIDGEPLPEPIASHRAAEPAGGRGDWLGALFAAFVVATIVRGMFGRAPGALRGLPPGVPRAEPRGWSRLRSVWVVSPRCWASSTGWRRHPAAATSATEAGADSEAADGVAAASAAEAAASVAAAGPAVAA
ncbi:hypothetical protein GCM10007164_19370 [Luteimonas padinae]|nr:hypothetical protein GCM10007164_19370 [Luteimonas padinae]